ncbi:MAG: ABC transporter ATP-binding protein [Clostridia bacterium]|nr:ABC transporter ATP-binding protein [Clostridia bacterium]
MVRTFISYYKPHWKLFAVDMLCAFLVACCDLVYPMIAKDIINVYVPNRSLRLVIVWSVVMLVIYAAKCLLNFVVQYWGHIVGVRMQGDMRRDMFRHLQKLPFSFFDENKTGTLMSRMINDLQEVSELAHHGPENIFLAAVMLIGSFVLLAGIDVWLAVIAFSLVPLMLLFSWRARRMMRDAFAKARVETGEVNANVETAIAGMRVSRAYTAADHEVNKFMAANARLIKAREKSYFAMGYFNSGTGLFTDLMYLVGLLAGGLFFYYGRINGGEFTAYILFINNFLKPINRIISFFEQFINGMTGFRRFQDIMAQQPEPEDANAVKPERLAGHIRFEEVSFRYRNSDSADTEARVIDHLNLEVRQGETLALVGPSGGGKTTLCHLIPRFYEPDSGVITIDGMDVRAIDRMALRKNIGMVAQEVFLFNGTIKENIAYGDLEASDEAIIEAAKKASIHDYIMTLENGYDTQVGERGVKLSGGQKQRISIARVFLKNPPILILDEATSALDNATEMAIQASLEELGKGRTTIVVAHRLSTIKHANEIVVLTRDGIAEQGTHEQLMEKDGIYAGLYKYQFKN